MSDTRDAARTIAEKLEYFAAEGARPDEWLLREWAGILRNALAAPGAEAAAPVGYTCSGSVVENPDATFCFPVYAPAAPDDGMSEWERDELAEAAASATQPEACSTPRMCEYGGCSMRCAQPEAPAALRPTDDELWDQTLRERDRYHDMADKLAAAIAEHLGVEIGEHSNLNCPWEQAFEAITRAPAVQVPPMLGRKWLPIATAPKEGRRIDLLVDTRRYIGCYWDHICSEFRTIDNGGILIRLKGATHWMPEPPLPEQADASGVRS